MGGSAARIGRVSCLALLAISLAGCGVNKSRLATEQLVVSDSVDRTVAAIDFSPISGQKVFFDTQYLEGLNMGATGNVKYLISSLRQQMLAYDCRLQEKADTADYIVEARVGVLANDGHETTYGIPGSAALGTASMLMASPLAIPALPELSLGRRSDHAGTTKVGVFAYDRVTREPVWQAGVRKESSEARDTWLLGLGPYQKRERRTRNATAERPLGKNPTALSSDPLAAYSEPIVFERALHREAPPESKSEVATASHTEPAPPEKITPAPDARPVAEAKEAAK
jgi:hypothetical protein